MGQLTSSPSCPLLCISIIRSTFSLGDRFSQPSYPLSANILSGVCGIGALRRGVLAITTKRERSIMDFDRSRDRLGKQRIVSN